MRPVGAIEYAVLVVLSMFIIISPNMPIWARALAAVVLAVGAHSHGWGTGTHYGLTILSNKLPDALVKQINDALRKHRQ